MHVEETLFSVHINPYFLRLTLPGRVLEDDNSSAQYEPSSGVLTVTLTKETPGEDFKDLDILATLLAPRRPEPAHPLIEVVGSDHSTQQNDEEELVNATAKLDLDEREIVEGERYIDYLYCVTIFLTRASAAENDWQLSQKVPDINADFQTSSVRHYGFLDMYTDYFRHVGHTENEVNELGEDVEKVTAAERRKKRLAHEEKKWDEEHYM